ncbi:MAG: TlpA family protein disulfide reductase [Sulfurospirillaceae bacterium]|nr:TlpA family protein disulfide reductase [Sulfurospirillaceae bacterium]MDD3463772.1 TlpA family protein disulfide reductase [Sulfurospirillaceae bacterium]
MRFYKALLILVVTLFFVACGGEKQSSTPLAKEVYKDGDKIELKSVTGSKVTLLRKNGGFVIEGEEGKIILVDIFGTFCTTCQDEAPALMDYQLQNANDIFVLGLNYFEEVSDEYVVENFSSRYNAYYFISNAKENTKIINTILEDIAYKQTLQVPFKVVIKNGKYQTVTDIYSSNPNNKFYIGKVDLKIIEDDIDKIKLQ